MGIFVQIFTFFLPFVVLYRAHSLPVLSSFLVIFFQRTWFQGLEIWVALVSSIFYHLKWNYWRRKWQLTPLFLLENPMDGRAWWATVHGVAKSLIRVSDFTSTFNPQLRLSALVFVCYWLFSWVLKDLWPYFFLSCLLSHCITLHTVV